MSHSLLSPLKRQGLGTEPGNRHICFRNTARENSMVLAQENRHIDQGTEWRAQKYAQASTVALSEGIKNTRRREDSVYKQCEKNWTSMC